MVNKKIVGTQTTEYNDVKFKSTLEMRCYKLLEESGLKFTHESEKIDLWTGFKPTIDIWSPSKIRGTYKLTPLMEKQSRSFIKITYTPDFKVVRGNYIIYMDAKGFPNDVYGYKKKMFIKSLELRNDGIQYVFMEPHSIRQMKQAIEIIKTYEEIK